MTKSSPNVAAPLAPFNSLPKIKESNGITTPVPAAQSKTMMKRKTSRESAYRNKLKKVAGGIGGGDAEVVAAGDGDDASLPSDAGTTEILTSSVVVVVVVAGGIVLTSSVVVVVVVVAAEVSEDMIDDAG